MTKSAASSGSEEKERTPITGFAGLTFTSATGAKFWVMPTARSSCPVMAAAARASSTLRPAPNAMLPGNSVAGAPNRRTAPCSWSMEMVSGTPAPEESAASCTPFDSSATCRGLSSESVQEKWMMPPRWYRWMISAGVARPNSSRLLSWAVSALVP